MNECKHMSPLLNIEIHSWGTKGDNSLPMDLGVASKPVNTEKGIEEVEVEMAEEQEMIDKYYDAALQNLQIKQDIVTQVGL